MAPAKAKHDRLMDAQTDEGMDDGQSDPYVAFCFAGAAKMKH